MDSLAKQPTPGESNELSGRSNETFSSFSKMPNIVESQLVYQIGYPKQSTSSPGDSLLVKVIE